MYQLEQAYVRRNSRNDIWVPQDISDHPIKTVDSTYGDVWLFVTYASITEPRAVLLSTIRNLLNGVGPSVTTQEWLTSLGNKTLPFHTTPPDFQLHYVRYINAWHAGYRIAPIGRKGTLSQQGSKWEKEDLLVSRPDVKPETLARNALFTVNGLFHPTEYGPEGVHIHEGNTTLRHSNDNQIGLYSFAKVGHVRCIPVTPEMVSAQRPDAPLWRGVYVTLPEDVEMGNKTYLLVIGGYLQVLGKTYTRVGERTYRVELSNLMMMERFYDSRVELNLHDVLGFTEYDFNESLLSVAEIGRDETVLRYMTLPQTFFVEVEAETFFQELVPVEDAGLPGRYYDYDTPYYPLMGAYGRMLEYHPIEEDGITVLCAEENHRHRYDFQRRPWRTQNALDGGRYPANPFDHTQAFYRLLGSQS